MIADSVVQIFHPTFDISVDLIRKILFHLKQKKIQCIYYIWQRVSGHKNIVLIWLKECNGRQCVILLPFLFQKSFVVVLIYFHNVINILISKTTVHFFFVFDSFVDFGLKLLQTASIFRFPKLFFLKKKKKNSSCKCMQRVLSYHHHYIYIPTHKKM